MSLSPFLHCKQKHSLTPYKLKWNTEILFSCCFLFLSRFTFGSISFISAAVLKTYQKHRNERNKSSNIFLEMHFLIRLWSFKKNSFSQNFFFSDFHFWDSSFLAEHFNFFQAGWMPLINSVVLTDEYWPASLSVFSAMKCYRKSWVSVHPTGTRPLIWSH